MANQNQSPPAQRSSLRKAQQQQQAQTQSQQQQLHHAASSAVVPNARRETSPSPSLRELEREQRDRQRYARTQSMPIVATQAHPNPHQHLHSIPHSSYTHPNPDYDNEFDFDDAQASPQVVSTTIGTTQSSAAAGYAGRPIPVSRVSQPQFRQQGQGQQAQTQAQQQLEKWQMTEDLQADIDRADLLQQQQQQRQGSRSPASISSVSASAAVPASVQTVAVAPIAGIQLPPPGQPPAPGTAGVAYAGGAASAGTAFVSHVKTHSSGSTGIVSNVSVGVGVGTNDLIDASGGTGVSASAAAAAARRRTTIATEQSSHRGSPLSYALRKGANTSPGYPSMPSPRSMKNRTPDRSLPVQEEPDEHDSHQHVQQQQHQQARSSPMGGRVTPSPAPSSDLNPTNDLDHDGEGTLVDLGDDSDENEADNLSSGTGVGTSSGGAGGSGQQESTEGEGSGTPRSPANALYPQSHGIHAQRGIHEVLQPDKQHTNTNGTSKFNQAEFQQTLKKLQGNGNSPPRSHPYAQQQYQQQYHPPPVPTAYHPPPHAHPHRTPAPPVPPPPFSPFSRADFSSYSRNESRGSYPNWMFDFYHNYPTDDVVQNGGSGAGAPGGDYYDYDEAANAYMNQFLPGPPHSGGSMNGGIGGYPTPVSTQGSQERGTGTGISTRSGMSGRGHSQTRPDAPIPPTPHSQTSAPTPFRRQQNGDDGENVDENEEGSRGSLNGHHEEQEHQGENGEQEHDPSQRFVPSYSPAPPSRTPYPYPFSHVRRGFVYPRPSYPSHAAPPPPSSAIPRVPSSVYDPSVVQEQLRLQMQMYAYNNYNNGMMTDSTISQASTPYPGMGPGYTPFGAFLNQSRAYALAARERERADGRMTGLSMRSSPSHEPVPLRPLYASGKGRGALKKQDGVSNLRGRVNGAGDAAGAAGTGGSGGAGEVGARGRERVNPPPRVESTQPRDTSPEDLSSGEETAGEKFAHHHVEHRDHAHSHSRYEGSHNRNADWVNGVIGYEEQENGEWVDEESDEEDLLDLELHPSYVTNVDRRRKRWDSRWEDLVRAFQALDRETDTTLLLLASPSHTNKLYSLSSRSIRRDASLFDGHAIHASRSAFEQIASQRRSSRSYHRASLLERLYAASSPSASRSQSGTGAAGDANGASGGDGTTNENGNEANEREEDLRKLLRTALHSLSALHQVYEEREGRWRIEERRMREEREGVELLVRQAFGEGYGGYGSYGGYEGYGGGGGAGGGGPPATGLDGSPFLPP